MVLYCVFEPGKSWELLLTTNSNAFDNSDSIQHVEDAVISLTSIDRGLTRVFASIGGGKYQLKNEYPVAGAKYKILVEHPEFATLTAESEVPAGFSFEILERSILNWDDEKRQKFSVRFESGVNLPGQLIVQNRLSRLYLDSNTDTIIIEDWDVLKHSSVADAADVFLPVGTLEEILCFEGFDNLLEFDFFSLNGFRKEDETFLVKGEGELMITRSSDAYYQYTRSLEIYRKSENTFVSSIAPPAEIIGNVEGGLGIFAGKNQQVFHYSF